MDYVSEALSDYKQLRGGVVFMETIPRTLLGKIDRKALREAYADGTDDQF